ncbi:hypothetical protein [Providencia sp.]|uniref:hypothetical protein n=1 Tax=Providencia sp. TaxID=589 RepID=UPI000E9E33A7|nr:hypothetical protein [Providencia sp.]MBP6081045.1 hypothetical protein [Providencia sp.]HBO23389.1 hypothetical protein [Providencia sp.]
MSEKTPPDIKQTVAEKVLIKHQVLSTDKYRKAVTQQAQKKANEYYQQAKQEQEALYQTAYQHGYNEGIKQLLADFINVLATSEKQYQEKAHESESQLTKLLTDFFADNRLQEIVALYFEKQQHKAADIALHLPANLQSRFAENCADLKLLTSTENTIALEVDNKITYFSPSVATKNILPHVFSVPTQCQILQERKNAYQNLIELMNLTEERNDDANQPTN